MANEMKIFVFFLVFLLINSVFLATEGHDLLHTPEAQSPPLFSAIEKSSPGSSDGHKFDSSNTSGGIKAHVYVNAEEFGNIKNVSAGPGATSRAPSGPSPGGDGH
ncbi:hypothetical protein Salat_2456200 [Sesamum alatum]|uniref:Uncharacterized protein n=1 Tax=Sesamum alatum TaxID=300844 RepID=A0AAE1XRL4_9LAMI|nr:hypothetical protein Salat_2456200 [Sesamum alatum]